MKDEVSWKMFANKILSCLSYKVRCLLSSTVLLHTKNVSSLITLLMNTKIAYW